MVNKEVSIASSLLGVFNTLENWRKVDPELPITVLAHSAADVPLENGQLEASQVSLTLRNDHSGTITVSPHSGSVTIVMWLMSTSVQMRKRNLWFPGQSMTWKDTVLVPPDHLRDSVRMHLPCSARHRKQTP